LPTSSSPSTAEGGDPAAAWPRLASLQLVVVTGKGGVGKSVITACLGRLLADAGRTVLLMETDPRESLHHLLDIAPSGGGIVPAGARLFLQNLQPRRVLDDLVRERLKIPAMARRVLGSAVYQHFAEAAPGLKEAGVLGRALRLVEGHGPRELRRPDVVVLDAPATGHGITFLQAPMLVRDVVRSGPVGRMAADITAFVTDPQRTGIVVVTSAEEMPVQEAVELIAGLDERLRRRPELIVVNGLYPPVPAGDPGRSNDTRTAFELWRRRRAINERELERLAAAWSGPRIHLPLVAEDRGPRLLATLAGLLAAGLGVRPRGTGS